MLKNCLIALPLSVALNAIPITETSSSGQWVESNRANLRRGEVIRNGEVLFKIERLGNVAFLSLPKKPNALQRSLWEIEIFNEGHTFFATWDKAKGAWKFNLNNSGAYDVYVSKKKNNIDKISYAWFSLTY